jgi:hypothetical protein
MTTTPMQSIISCGKSKPHGLVRGRFYRHRMSPLALQQAMLLYGSNTWVLSKPALASLEGFHITAAYWMARKHEPWRGPQHRWINPKSKGMLEECGMSTLEEYNINVCQQTITVYVATRPILTKCRQGEPKRGAVLHRWWQEQSIDLDAHNATGSGD